mgnify:CR=1 FL=1
MKLFSSLVLTLVCLLMTGFCLVILKVLGFFAL